MTDHASVRLLLAGGTIAMSGSPARPDPGVVAELRRHIGGHVEAEPFLLAPSVHFTRADALALGRRAAELAAAGTPVVITHGTDLLEETAFLCDLLHDGDAPIVLTGAMRTASAPGADGPANLQAAVSVAADERARGAGALVVFAGEVHAARCVRKADSTSPAAFASPQTGPLGRVAEGRLTLAWRPARHPALIVDRLDARVEILTAALDSDPALARAAASVCDGLVVSVPGAGHTPPAFLQALAEIAERRPVVAVARPWRGAILHDTYGFAGAEADLRASAIICAGGLSAPAARIALLAALGAGLAGDELRRVLERYD